MKLNASLLATLGLIVSVAGAIGSSAQGTGAGFAGSIRPWWAATPISVPVMLLAADHVRCGTCRPKPSTSACMRRKRQSNYGPPACASCSTPVPLRSPSMGSTCAPSSHRRSSCAMSQDSWLRLRVWRPSGRMSREAPTTGAATPLGPAYFGWGWTQPDRNRWYLVIGERF